MFGTVVDGAWAAGGLNFDHLNFDHLNFDHLNFDHLNFDHLEFAHTVAWNQPMMPAAV